MPDDASGSPLTSRMPNAVSQLRIRLRHAHDLAVPGVHQHRKRFAGCGRGRLPWWVCLPSRILDCVHRFHDDRAGPDAIMVPGREATVTSSSFEIRYAAPLKPLLMAMGMGPDQSGIEVTSDEVRVRMGWAFRVNIPIRDVRLAERSARPIILGYGVHGWAGRWLVNGSGKGVVRIEIDPAARGSVMGIPVRLATLLVSVAEPKRLIDTVNRIGIA